MGNQESNNSEQEQKITNFYKQVLEENKENCSQQHSQISNPQITRSIVSKNKLRPTTLGNIDRVRSSSNEKQLKHISLSQQSSQLLRFQPTITNPLEKLTLKKQISAEQLGRKHAHNISYKSRPSEDQYNHTKGNSSLNILHSRHDGLSNQGQCLSELQINPQEIQPIDKDQRTPLFTSQQSLDQSFKFIGFKDRSKSYHIHPSFSTLVLDDMNIDLEDRCKPQLKEKQSSYKTKAVDQQALQFLLQNCTYAQSRTKGCEQEKIDSLKQSKSGLLNSNIGTAQFILESQRQESNDRKSSLEACFKQPHLTGVSCQHNYPEEIWVKNSQEKQKFEIKKIMLILDDQEKSIRLNEDDDSGIIPSALSDISMNDKQEGSTSFSFRIDKTTYNIDENSYKIKNTMKFDKNTQTDNKLNQKQVIPQQIQSPYWKLRELHVNKKKILRY